MSFRIPAPNLNRRSNGGWYSAFLVDEILGMWVDPMEIWIDGDNLPFIYKLEEGVCGRKINLFKTLASKKP